MNCYVYYCSQVRTTIMVPSGTQGRYGDMRNSMYNWITAMILRQNCGFSFFGKSSTKQSKTLKDLLHKIHLSSIFYGYYCGLKLQ